MSLLKKLGSGKFGRRLVLPAALFLGLSAFQCSKTSTGPDPEPEPSDTGIVYQDNSVILEPGSSHGISNVDGNKIIFSNPSDQVKQIEAGDVVSFPPSNYFNHAGNILKVNSISVTKDTLFTSGVTLEGLIKQGKISNHKVWSPSDKVSFVGMPGVILKPSSVQGFDFELSYEKIFYDKDGNPNTTDDQAVFRAGTNFNLETDISLEYSFAKFQSGRVALNFSEETFSELVSGCNAFDFDTTFFLGTMDLGAFPISPGVYAKADLELYLNLTGDFSSFETRLTQNLDCGGILKYSNASWTDSSFFNNSFNLSLEFPNGENEITASFGPKCNLKLYGFFGPYLEAKATSRLHANLFEDPWYILYGGAKIDVGIEAKILGKSIFDYDFNIANVEKPLVQSDGPLDFCLAELVVSPDSGSAPLVVKLDGTSSLVKNSPKYFFSSGDGQIYSETPNNAPDGNFDGITSFIYTTPGEYTARIDVNCSDEYSDFSTAFAQVKVTSPEETLEGIILFSSVRGDDCNIYSINPDGTGEKKLVGTSSEWELLSAVSPDGRKILYSSMVPFSSDNYDIYAMNLDGSGKTQLTFGGMHDLDAVFSPDGNKIAYLGAYVSGYYDLYIMNSDGSESDRIIVDDNFYFKNLSWAPSDRLLIVSDYEGNDEIYSMDPDGLDIRRLTNNSAWESRPSYSPDGNKIVFCSNNQIYSMNSDGLNIQNLSQSPNTYDQAPYFSPDGKNIVYTSRPVGEDVESNELWIMSVDGSGKIQVTKNSYNEGISIWATKNN